MTTLSAIDELRSNLTDRFNSMMKALYSQGSSQFRVDILAGQAVRDFIDAHSATLNSSMSQIRMSEAMRRRLERSNYIFSGIKTFHQLNEAFPSLIDENGNRKPFERFLNDVRSIDLTYNGNYLRAEYNFVAASAEMAAKWEGFMQDGDRYCLQYRTQKDDKVRPEHAALDGVTLPPSDPFWAQFYPPNGWNCRCTVVQVRKSKYPATPHDEAMRLGDEALQRDTKGIFRFNPGLEQKTFPDYNPYTIRRCRSCSIPKGEGKLARFVSDNELCRACVFIRTCLEQRRDPGFISFKRELMGEATRIQKESENLATGRFYQTRKSFKRGIGHARNAEEAEMYSIINEHASDMVFMSESPLGEGKDLSNPKEAANVEKKRQRGVTGYNIYSLRLNGDVWLIKTEVHRGASEAIYHLRKIE